MLILRYNHGAQGNTNHELNFSKHFLNSQLSNYQFFKKDRLHDEGSLLASLVNLSI
jgi:hypothetical protein